ncbi:hypothetical protein ASE04_09775 [Rhizobium sp. Root708]|uniref:hypothetical protein n=1 Tax=Rhizobium sp. Root708 TaxID=1736592 RepID=UPI0006F38B38|nr:hypothetical protein [Rhizobium sp. Root708]KRB51809.1 hypothetical protein ASE04_09775 [Rhizobium sp. Root708]
MKTPIQSAGEAVPAIPSASDILADYSRLLTVISISTEMVSDMSAEGMTPAMKGLLFNTQNMTSIAQDLATKLDKDLDAYLCRSTVEGE